MATLPEIVLKRSFILSHPTVQYVKQKFYLTGVGDLPFPAVGGCSALKAKSWKKNEKHSHPPPLKKNKKIASSKGLVTISLNVGYVAYDFIFIDIQYCYTKGSAH